MILLFVYYLIYHSDSGKWHDERSKVEKNNLNTNGYQNCINYISRNELKYKLQSL